MRQKILIIGLLLLVFTLFLKYKNKPPTWSDKLIMTDSFFIAQIDGEIDIKINRH